MNNSTQFHRNRKDLDNVVREYRKQKIIIASLRLDNESLRSELSDKTVKDLKSLREELEKGLNENINR